MFARGNASIRIAADLELGEDIYDTVVQVETCHNS